MLTVGPLLAALVVASAVAASQPPHKQASGPEKAASNPASQQAVSVSPPATTNLSVSSDLQIDPEECHARSEEPSFKFSDWLLVLFNGILAFYTARLWISTEKLGQAGERQLAISQKLATIGEQQVAIQARQTDIQEKQHGVGREQFFATHRPKLVVRMVSLDVGDDDHTPKIEYSIANTGGSNATLVAISAKPWFVGPKNLPAKAPYESPTEVSREVISGIPEPASLELKESAELLVRMAVQGKGGLLFLGFLDYEDKVGRRRRTAFLREFNPATGRFDPINHPDYEYQD